MDNNKFEQLIDLIINENEEQARALFHDIVVEKSREIYESMMDEDDGMEGSQIGTMMDEIGVEESGVVEGEGDDLDIDAMKDDEKEFMDVKDDNEGEEVEDEIEDRVSELENKLDQLMAEFEDIIGDTDEEDDMMAKDTEDGFDDEQEFDDEEDFSDEDSEEMMEAIQLQKVSVTHGDNGAQTKSPSLVNSGQAGMDSRPVKFSGQTETVPTGPKGPSNNYARGETQVKGASSFKNVPGQRSQSLDSAPKPVKSQATGVNTSSPVAESRRTTKRSIK